MHINRQRTVSAQAQKPVNVGSIRREFLKNRESEILPTGVKCVHKYAQQDDKEPHIETRTGHQMLVQYAWAFKCKQKQKQYRERKEQSRKQHQEMHHRCVDTHTHITRVE